MSNILIPYDEKNIKATYSSKGRSLTVVADGPAAPRVLSMKFEKSSEIVLGGLKLKLLGNIGGGIPSTGDNKLNATYIINDMASPPSYKAITVVLAIDFSPSPKSRECTIPIVVDPPVSGGGGVATDTSTAQGQTAALVPSTMPSRPIKLASTAQTAQTINVYLLAGGTSTVRISCPMLDSSVFRYEIEAHCDDDLLRIWRSGIVSGSLYWDVIWMSSATALGTKSNFTLVTSKAAVKDTSAIMAVTVQPYIVSCSKPPVDTSKGPIDLFDPNA